jgi:hypothetical protein
VSRDVPWRKRLSTRLAGIAFALLVVSGLLVVGNHYLLAWVRGDTASMVVFSSGRMYCYEMLYLLYRLFDPNNLADRQQIAADLSDAIAREARRSGRSRRDRPVHPGWDKPAQ